MTREEYVQRLKEISEKKYGLLKEMLELTVAQSQTISEEGLEDLQKLIDEKQKRIDAINKLDEEFDVYFRRFKSELGVKDLNELQNVEIPGVKELKESIGRIVSVIEEISTLEVENNRKAQDLLKKFGEEIKRINQGKKISSAYTPTPERAPAYFIDKKK